MVPLRGNKDLAFLENKRLVWKFTLSLGYNAISAHTTAARTPCDHRLEGNASLGSAASSSCFCDMVLFGLEVQRFHCSCHLELQPLDDPIFATGLSQTDLF